VNTQRAAAGIGAFLVLVIGATLCVVTAGALAGLTASGTFGLTFKTFLVLALLTSTLGSLMKWGQGGSTKLWLGIALAAYVAAPTSWVASTLFARGAGAPPALAWFVDGILWMAVAAWTAKRVLPQATVDDGLLRLR
jgi:hypothetical protein